MFSVENRTKEVLARVGRVTTALVHSSVRQFGVGVELAIHQTFQRSGILLVLGFEHKRVGQFNLMQLLHGVLVFPQGVFVALLINGEARD